MITKEQQENRDRWLNALETEKYPRGEGSLEWSDGVCCLGVAFRELGATYTKDEMGRGLFDKQVNYLSVKMQNKLGLEHRDPIVSYCGQFRTLSELNDRAHLSHREIARVIRAQGDGWTGESPKTGLKVELV